MKRRFTSLALAALAGQALPGWAQDTVKSAQVQVTASQGDTQTRREFVAGKIIISRKRIADSGVRTVEELLKREPAVTVSGDGRIGLLNMPGYTQVLVDGHAPPAGLSPGQLDVAHVEKIEIIKSSVAEYGPFGIAGTINIVTRKTVRKTDTQLSTTLSSVAGRPGANLSLSHNQSTAGSPLRISVDLSAGQSNRSTQSQVRQTLSTAGQVELEQSQAAISAASRTSDAAVSGNLTWQRSADETVTVAPQLWLMRTPSEQREVRRRIDGTVLNAQQHADSSLDMLILPLDWNFKPGKKSRVNLSLRATQARMESSVDRLDSMAAQQPTARYSAQHSRAHSRSAELGYRVSLDGGHDLKTGVNARRSVFALDYDSRVDGLPDPSLGTMRQAVSDHLRLFVQDEWRISEQWALNAGMSGERDAIDVSEAQYRGQASFLLWSPSLHVSRKLGDDDKRQLRLSLARTFKAPQDSDFTLRPDIHPLAPCPAGGACGPNTVDTADKSGNLGLRPERALGLNLEYEHGIGDDSQITLAVFARQISGKIGKDITQESVPWASAPRYVVRPVNLGDASTGGVNLELELALRDLSKAAPKITVRGGAGLARSRVTSLPGPDNRLDQQTPWTAKLGASYTMGALKFDADADWSPSDWFRTSQSQRVFVERRFGLDGSARWTINKEQRLVLSVKTRSPHSAQQVNDYLAGDEQVRQYTGARKYSVLSVRFDTKL